MSETDSGQHWVGLDLGGTKILTKVYNGSFKTLSKQRKKTRGSEGPSAVVSRMVRTVRDALADAEIEVGQVGGLGIGVPGPIDQERGVVLDAVNLSWENMPLGEMMEDEFGCPVVICNDVDAGVYGEYRFGAGQGARTVVGVFPGTGIGGGCVYDGMMVRGRNISCMEIGHQPVSVHGRLCGCGLHGCLETEASRLAISAEVAAAAYRGEAPNLLQAAGTDLANIRSGVLAKAIADGDTVVEGIVRRAAGRLGVGLSGIIHLLAPDKVVLGGGLVEAMPELYLSAVTKSVRRNVMPAFADTFKIVAAELGDDASVLGAAAWAQKSVALLAASS